MKQANLVWDAKTLDSYLADPQSAFRGNKMPFPGLKTEQDRADVVAFLLALPPGAQARRQARRVPRRRPRLQPPQPRRIPQQQIKRNSNCTGGPISVTFRTPNTPCDQESPKAGMVFIGVGGSQSTVKRIRC